MLQNCNGNAILAITTRERVRVHRTAINYALCKADSIARIANRCRNTRRLDFREILADSTIVFSRKERYSRQTSFHIRGTAVLFEAHRFPSFVNIRSKIRFNNTLWLTSMMFFYLQAIKSNGLTKILNKIKSLFYIYFQLHMIKLVSNYII